MNKQMFWIFTSNCSGEAFDIIKGVEKDNGGEAWRKLCARYDSRTLGKEMQLARQVVSPPKIKSLRDAVKGIDKWESDVRRLKRYFDEDRR